MREAQEALATAEEWMERGSATPLIRAYVLERKAVILYSEGSFAESISTAAEATGLYTTVGKSTLAGRTSVSQAIALLYSGQPEEAIRVLKSAIPLFDRSNDGLLLLAAHQNLAAAFVESGQAAETIAVLDSVRDLYREHPDLTLRLRARILQGDLFLQAGHLESAEKALLEARVGLTALGLEQGVAFASLTLAEVYYQQGKRKELRRILTETFPAGPLMSLGPAAVAAMLRLQAAAGPVMPGGLDWSPREGEG
jgi:tetratricopeptide (TPR) repeat protein